LEVNKIRFHLNSPKGFTLIELLVALTLTAVIGAAIVIAMTQLFTRSVEDKDHMEAVKQVENALHYLNRDVQSAQFKSMEDDELITPDDIDTPLHDLPLHLRWTDFANNSTVHSIDYTLSSNSLTRTETINSETTSFVAAQNITQAKYKYYDGTLTFNITASVGTAPPESRTFQVTPRSNR
jgi:prepilin-type N-terminal cleavage/methylation domain-containing protein